MQAVFKKIIEKLEEQKVKGIYDSSSIIGEKNVWAEAIEIVKQEAEQYQSSEICFISKTEVLKLIEEIKCNDNIPKNYGTLLDIMRMIRNMPTVDNTDNGWIPCSERLPEEHITKDGHVDPSEEVLVYIYYGENCVSNGCGVSRYWEHTKFHKNPWIDLECGKENVVAWQPLPPEYQPKGE